VSGYPAWSADHATKRASATAAGSVVGSSRSVAASRDVSEVRSATSREGTFRRAVRTLVYHDIAPREGRDEVGFPGPLAARYKLEPQDFEAHLDALAASETWVAQSGALAVHAFDQRETLLGQGSIALELTEQAPGLDTLLVPVGGGGLIGGIAAWYAGQVKVVGVEPEAAPTLSRALAAGHPVDAEAGGLAADSLAPRRVGELMFPIAQRHVAGVVLVTDDAIRQAQKALWSTLRIVAEPGGAAAFAALLSGRYRPQAGERVGVLISGGNTTAVDFDR